MRSPLRILAALPLPVCLQLPTQVPSIPPQPYRARFAVIGDYGTAGPNEASVAALVAGWNPEFVITAGDNNYVFGDQSTIDANIGQYYSAFIHPYTGTYGSGGTVNRFFPSLGNHDWYTAGAAPYLAYFTLPGNERYYEFVRGPVRFFALDSDPSEPDGILATSNQAAWLRARLAASTSPFNVVYFHHPPYSSSSVHGNTVEMQWPFREWGADLVIAGHDHSFERLVRDGFPYYVCGTGGYTLYALGPVPVSGSAARFNSDFGAMIVEADESFLTAKFVTQGGAQMDTFGLPHDGVDFADVALVQRKSGWRYKDDGSNQGTVWRAPGFDDSGWARGRAQLGYGDGDEATTVSYGPNPNARYITTYFRHAFEVPDPTVFRSLSLEILRDDGAVAYLNGVEVHRTNMPAGTIGYLTTAAAAIGDPVENAYWGGDLSPSLLVAGTNQLAVEVHQANGTSSDLGFALTLTGTLRGTALSPAGATWSYLDTGVDPGPAWTSAGFDDSAWASGPAQLGYGDGDEATVVGYGPDPANKYRTTWFRRTFTAANPETLKALLLRVLRDDGVAVYLNGTEIYRSNLPESGLSSASLAAFDVIGVAESSFTDTFADARLLLAGANVLAVEVHQFSAGNADLSFDLELSGL